MEKVDYIIVGDGYAAIFFAHQLIKNKKSFKLFSQSEIAASHISAGVCNPLVLKRFAEIWKANEQLIYLKEIFDEIKAYTNKQYLINEQVVRVFHDESEKDLWLKKKHIQQISDYLNPNFLQLKSVDNKFSSGKVNQSCRIDVSSFFVDMFSYLEVINCLIRKKFNYTELNIDSNTYNNFVFDKIIFAEGIAVNHNPLFAEIPIIGNKGHCLKVKIQDFVDPYIIKKKHFLFQWKQQTYFVGGTYERDEKDLAINPTSVKELEDGLKEIFSKKYDIEEVHTAFRAVVKDRRPVIGRHSKHENVFILNGLGARGVFNGTYYSKQLYDFIENEKEIDPEVDIIRFYNN